MKKIFLSLFLLINSICFAQVISGTVTDSVNQTGIAGAKVLIINTSSSVIDSIFTNASGNWSYDFLTDLNENSENIPTGFLIAQNYPNPFNPSTTIEFNLPQSGNVQILVHNILGQLIDSREQFLTAGSYSIKWNARGSAGVYFYTIKTEKESITNKMILLDGGNGTGLSNIQQGNKLQKFSANKSASIQASITISKFAYLSQTINTAINGGEHFATQLVTIHSNATLIDLHNDILEVMLGEPSYHLGTLHTTHHTDIPRLQKGGVDIQFFSDWVSPTQFSDTLYFDQTQVMIDILNNEIALNPNTIGQARNPQEALALNNDRKNCRCNWCRRWTRN